jgi:hypothetical protein
MHTFDPMNEKLASLFRCDQRIQQYIESWICRENVKITTTKLIWRFLEWENPTTDVR